MIAEKLIAAFKRKFPDSPIWRIPKDGVFDKFIKAIVGDDGTYAQGTLTTAVQDAVSILDQMMPDNPNFTLADAHDWYRRLGIPDPGTLDLPTMSAVIMYRLSFPTDPDNELTAAYIQAQLVAAGYTEAIVVKNLTPPRSWHWSALSSWWLETAMCGSFMMCDTMLGTMPMTGSVVRFNKVANSLDPVKDGYVLTLPPYGNTYVIYLSSSIYYPVSTEPQVRQLILQLKAAQDVVWLEGGWS